MSRHDPNDFLSTEQLARLYRIDGQVALSQWYRAIERWRDQGLLRLPDHIQPVGSARHYLHVRVCNILWTSDRLFAERVRYCNHDLIRSILSFPRIPQK